LSHFVFLVLAGVLFGLPAAASPSGSYQCRMANGGSRAIIDFSSWGYRFSSADAEGRRVADGRGGTGGYDFADPFVIPLDGPLLLRCDCFGRLSSDGSRIEFSSRHGIVMTCHR
jgi:hypothetical protein